MGIMGTGTLDSERSLFHSTGKDLLDRFENREPILQEDPGASLSPRKHAPGVIYHDGSYHLFYRRPSGTIMRLVSKDPYRWAGLGTTVFSERDARDVCIRKYRDTFYMYYCQFITRENIGRSAILLRKSSDLMNWSNATVVHYDTERPCTHSYLESPSVLRREEGYYLFIRNRNYDKEVKTVVLFSKNPEDFPSGERKWFAELQPVHAAEIIAVGEEVFIARVSAPSKRVNYLAPDKGGWVEIARLRFE